jgi:hypothetical protein
MLDGIKAKIAEILDKAEHVFSCVQIFQDNAYLLALCKNLEQENQILRHRLGLGPDDKIQGLRHRRIEL